MNEQQTNKIDKVQYEAGCYKDEEPSLFKNTQVGQYYDYGHEVSLEIRSNEDPYMVFSYAWYNLGTDFTMFKYHKVCFATAVALHTYQGRKRG